MVVLAVITGHLAAAQSDAPGPAGTARPGPGDAAPYCDDLRRVLAFALTKQRFSAIAGKPRDGDFRDTQVRLAGWRDCSVYGTRTYTCDYRKLDSAAEAAKTQIAVINEIRTCLGERWAQDHDRSSGDYAVLRSSDVPVSLTISTSADSRDGYALRLTIFLRSGG